MNFKRIKAIVIRHFYNFKHNLDRLSDGIYWPAMDIILWGLTSQYIQTTSAENDIVLILLSGLIFWQIIWRGQYEITVNILEEMWSQNLVSLISSPLTINEWIFGLLVLGILKMIVTLIITIGLTWILYSVSLLSFGFLLIPFFISLLMVGWWVGLMVASFIIRFGRHIQTFAWAGVYLLAPFSAMYYPVSSLPGWAQTIAKILPSSYIFEGMRHIIVTGKVPVGKLLISFILNLFYLALAFFMFKKGFKTSKEQGLERLQ